MGASIEELMSVLGKSGIPLPQAIGGNGDASSMQNAAPGASQNIASTVQGQDTTIPALRSSFHDQLGQIASMDSKLHELYHNPSSPMHLNDPGKALRLETGASNQGYTAANNIRSNIKSQQSVLDKKVSDAVDLYSKLTTLQSREESRAATAAKQDAKVGAGKGRYVTDATGQKVVVPTYKGKGGGGNPPGAVVGAAAGMGLNVFSKKVTDSQARAAEARNQKMQLAGLSDADAVAAFDNTKPGYQTWYFKTMQDAKNSGGGDVPPGGFSAKDVSDSYNWWQKNVVPQKKSSTSIFSKGSSSNNSGNGSYFP